jgi:hypothetical protein
MADRAAPAVGTSALFALGWRVVCGGNPVLREGFCLLIRMESFVCRPIVFIVLIIIRFHFSQ